MNLNVKDKYRAVMVTVAMLLLSCGYLLFLGYRLCLYGNW